MRSTNNNRGESLGIADGAPKASYGFKRRLAAICVVALSVLSVFYLSKSYAQTWSGGGSSPYNWSDGDNWVGGVAPTSGDSNLTLTFDGSTGTSTVQDLGNPFVLQSIVMASGADLYSISGDPIRFANLGAAPTIVHASSSYLDIISDVDLAQTLSIMSTYTDWQQQVSFSGTISGVGGLSFSGKGLSDLRGSSSNTYTGLTTVMDSTHLTLYKTDATAIAGDLQIIGAEVHVYHSDTSQIADTSIVSVTASATQKGSFEVGQDEAIGGLMLASVGNKSARASLFYSGVLTLLGDVTVAANTTGTAPALIDNHAGGVALKLGGEMRTFTVDDGNATDDLLISAMIDDTGGGGIIKEGAGRLRLSGQNSYTGGTTINGGVLVVDDRSLQGDFVNNNSQIEYLDGSTSYSGHISP